MFTPKSSLLKRQLHQAQEPDGSLNIDELVSLIDQAYEEAENDHRLLDNSLTSMSRELLETNQTLQKQASRLKDAGKQLAQSLSIAVSTLESTHDGILVMNSAQEVETYNHKFLEMWGLSEESMSQKGDAFFQLFLGLLEDPEKAQESIKKLFEEKHLVTSQEVVLKDGRFFEYYSQPQMMEGEVIGRVWSFRDITEHKHVEHRLSYSATHDALTGLPNRALVTDRLQQAITRAQNDHTIVAVLFCDLDRFKIINDSMGHAVGDALLKEVANRFVSCVRANDTVARMGGDEFVIVLNSLKSEQDILPVLERIIAQFAGPLTVEGGHVLATSTSVGVAVFPKDGETEENLLKNADAAMYLAKSMGRNNFQYYSEELNSENMKRVETHTLLQSAVHNQELLLHYQPISDTKTRQVVGAEALLRWAHPQLGMVPPQEFIPLAEETGLIVSIGEWVLEEACRQFVEWEKKEGLSSLFMSINLSPTQLKQKGTLEMFDRVLKKIPINPESIELEITESMILENSAHIMHTIDGFKKRGMCIVVDDFGTGYSSLTYLKRFPIDKLKIDRSFVNFLSENHDDVAIVKAIIAMAHNLGMKVVAEGVETQQQLHFLTQHHCDQVQGYYLGRPVPPQQFVEKVKAQS